MTDPDPVVLSVFTDEKRETLATALERMSTAVTVVAVDDVPAAKSVLANHRVDCVVSGYEVPDEQGRYHTGGLRFLEYVREQYESLPFVIFSEIVNEYSVRRAVTNGVTAYIRDSRADDVERQLSYHVRTSVDRRQAERTARELSRLNETVRDVNELLVRETTTAAIVEGICTRLAQDEAYRAVGFATVSSDGDVESWDVVTGDGTEPVSENGVVTAAVETNESQFGPDDGTAASPGTDEGSGEAVPGGTPTRIAIPVAYEGRTYGVLALRTDETHALIEAERAVLSGLGETVAHALNAVETRESLRRRERELTRQNDRLENFAGIVSHDLRNPLNMARGYLEQVRGECESEWLDDVDAAHERMDEIIADVLQLSKAQTDPLDVAPMSLESAVRNAWGNVETGAATLEVCDLPTVEGDASQLQRCFENLFRNSIQHGSTSPRSQTRGDGRESDALASQSESRVDSDDAVEHGTRDAEELTVRVGVDGSDLVVEDDGSGIDPDIVDSAFELGTTSSPNGTGFGLGIVDEIVTQHGWTITAENRDEGGARFRIRGVDA